MEKNAEFIRKKEFNIVFKGYKPEEVDKFLDILSVEFERLLKNQDELQENLDNLKFESSSVTEEVKVEDNDRQRLIEEAIISAHRTADEIKNNAQKEADEIKKNAQQEATELVRNKKMEEERAIKKLQEKKSSLEESLISVQNKYNDFKRQVKDIISNLNIAVDKVDSGFKREPPSKNNIPGVEAKEEDIKPEKQEESPKKEKLNKVSPGQEEQKDSEKQTGKSEGIEKDKSKAEQKEENEDINQRERKKIDIANPDIIESFFKSNNE